MENPHLTKIVHKLEHFCAYQERSLQEVEKKLANFQLSWEEKNEVIAHLKKYNFLNPTRYLHAFIRDKFTFRRWGKIRLKMELRKRGYQDQDIENGFDEILDEHTYQEGLLTLLKIKNRSIHEQDMYLRKQKLAKFALSRGYEMFLIWPAIASLNLGNFEEGDMADFEPNFEPEFD